MGKYYTEEEYNKLHKYLAKKLNVSESVVGVIRGLYFDKQNANSDITKMITQLEILNKKRPLRLFYKQAIDFLKNASEKDLLLMLQPFSNETLGNVSDAL